MRESDLKLHSRDATETRAIGAKLARAIAQARLTRPLKVALSGDLGAGKTTLVGGLLAELGQVEPVRSPTYTLVEPYRVANRDVYHCDLYRIETPEALEELGLRDLLVDATVMLVEWPDRAFGHLDPWDLEVRLEYSGDERTIEIAALTPPGRQVLEVPGLDWH